MTQPRLFLEAPKGAAAANSDPRLNAVAVSCSFGLGGMEGLKRVIGVELIVR